MVLVEMIDHYYYKINPDLTSPEDQVFGALSCLTERRHPPWQQPVPITQSSWHQCVCVRVSRVISADLDCVPQTTAEPWHSVSRVYVCVRAHAALLPRWLNYEAFAAVVMASSAFGNMSFYFCLGPNIQFAEGSQTIHDLFKKGKMRK